MKNIVYKLFSPILFFLALYSPLFAQNPLNHYQLQWPSDTLRFFSHNKLTENTFFPRYDFAVFGSIPSVYLKIPVNKADQQVEVQVGKQSRAVLPAGFTDGDKIKSDLQINYHTVIENGQKYLLLSFLPVIKNPDGTYQKVEEFSLTMNAVSVRGAGSNVANAQPANSVLANGRWYKIAVAAKGIYKLDYNFLKKLGLDVSNLDPRKLRLYGNGGYQLPQANSQSKPNDLQENAMFAVGEVDGRLDTDDYFLFYYPGNTEWKQNAQGLFEHQQNVYSDSAYYFLSADLGSAKRMLNNQTSGTVPQITSNSFDDYQLYEKDLYSAITSNLKSGRNWYGEDFEFTNSRDFNFNLPGLIVGEPLWVKTRMAIRANVSSFARVKLNNQNLYNLTANAVPLNFESDYAQAVSQTANISAPANPNLSLNISYDKSSSMANAWLDFVELNCRRQFFPVNDFLQFRDKNTVGQGLVQFNLGVQNMDLQVWDVTDMYHARAVQVQKTANESHFIADAGILKEYVAFLPSAFQTPAALGALPNQNLHALTPADFLIISAPEFLSEARRLAQYRKNTQGLGYHVVSSEQVYNEFSSGKRDASAIRDFVKMFYDRASANTALQPKYLLLFGKGSFDNRMLQFKQNNLLVTYQSKNSLSPTASYTSDDYFALLDDNEGDFSEDYNANPGLLDIAVGRIPAKNATEAKAVVDKLIAYEASASLGAWRNSITLVADDEDNNLHLNQAEANAALIAQNKNYNISKIYFDAYPQEIGAGGTTNPQAKEALNQKIADGTLLVNYTGHGGEGGWAQEKVLTIDDIENWQNQNKLPLIFTATCSFSRWDDPELVSAGELALLKSEGGVPSIFSTTRIVYSSYNFDLNQSFLKALLQDIPNGRLRFGDVFRAAKNNNIGGLNINSRNFTLLGDPTALFPIPQLGVHSTTLLDTLKAGEKVTVKGVVTKADGSTASSFNGVLYPVLFDKASTIRTLGQDAGLNGSYPQAFEVQQNVLYKGKASVVNGAFSFDFLVPRDINLSVGKGKISYYAGNELSDASGFSEIKVGGSSASSSNDKIGPTIKLYFNDQNFVSGGITSPNAVLLVKLFDESGINTTGIGIGHDVVATLSSTDMPEKSIVLNNYYQADVDSYQSGEIKYPFENLLPGRYTLKLKAWDVFNNSAEELIDFEVKHQEKLSLAHVLNYPNPFVNRTSFQFEHNYPNEELEVQVNIKTVTGKLVKTINQQIYSTGNRVNNIFWDAKDDFGEKIARGIYVYELKVRCISNGAVAKKTEKLLIL